MKTCATVIAAMLVLGTTVARAQTYDTSPPQPSHYGSISGSWLMPGGDFENIANDGWAITLEGYQYLTPTRKVAVGSQVGYQSFGRKNGVAVSNFPVDALIKFFPRPSARTEFYGTAGMGFNYQHTDVSYSSRSDYFFGTQAGVGLALHGSGAAGLIVDAVYHWIFATGTDTDFLALRAGLLLPLGARPR